MGRDWGEGWNGEGEGEDGREGEEWVGRGTETEGRK